MQKYCGCVFSEEDRYLENKKGLVTVQKYNNRPKRTGSEPEESNNRPRSADCRPEESDDGHKDAHNL